MRTENMDPTATHLYLYSCCMVTMEFVPESFIGDYPYMLHVVVCVVQVLGNMLVIIYLCSFTLRLYPG